MASEPIAVRPATAGDLPAVVAIYNEGIRQRVATFETRERDATEITPWLDGPLPFLVAEAGGEVLGWVRASPYSTRPAYAGVGEHSVYVATSARGRGVARLLLDEMVVKSEAMGLYKLTSRVFTDNLPSLATHRAAGFEVIGVLRRHGKLDGEWKDCAVVERLFGEALD